MNWNVLRALPFLFAIGACGGKTPEAQSPDGVDETASEEKLTPEQKTVLRAERAEAKKNHDDEGKKAAPCDGSEIDDLAAVLAQTSCLVPNAKPDEKQVDVKETLEIRARADRTSVSGGATSNITVTFRNKGKTALALDFVVDPEPRFDFEVVTAKGVRVDKPAGAEPPLPPEVKVSAEPERQIARVTLAVGGTAKLSLPWRAVKYKWASKEKAKGAVAGRGYPREAAGPLPKGKYVLRIVSPLVGVFEGADHEVSQPRLDIEVASPEPAKP